MVAMQPLQIIDNEPVIVTYLPYMMMLMMLMAMMTRMMGTEV